VSSSSKSPEGKSSSSPPLVIESELDGLTPQALLLRYRAWFTLGFLEMSVIHKMRNLFMSMMGNVELARDEMRSGRNAEKFLNDIDVALQMASHYTGWLQQPAEKRNVTLCNVELNQCCQEALKCLQQQSMVPCPMESDLNDNLPVVAADPVLVILILLELLSEANAAYSRLQTADIEKRNPSIRIESRLVEDGNSHGLSANRKWVELRIASSELRPWTLSSLKGGTQSDLFFQTHYSIELAKSVLTLFKGAVRFVNVPPQGEAVSLYFPSK
jgi:hypothetical protein